MKPVIISAFDANQYGTNTMTTSIKAKIGFTGHRDKGLSRAQLEEIAAKYSCALLWIHGGAVGFDTQIDDLAKRLGIKRHVERPQYDKYPKKYAPIARNKIIVDMSDFIIACFDGRNVGGTNDTIEYARKKGKQVIIYKPEVEFYREG